MSTPIGLEVPKQHLEILIYFFGLNDEVKKTIFFKLSVYSGELSPKKIVEYLAEDVDLEKKKIFDLSLVFLALVHSINSYTGTTDEFIRQIGESLVETFPDEYFDESRADQLKKLVENGAASSVKAKVLEMLFDNYRCYIDCKIIQDLRTNFDNNGQVIASGVVHNLKITAQEGRKRKDFYISMDDKDLEALSKEIKKAQENTKNMQTAFKNANILEL